MTRLSSYFIAIFLAAVLAASGCSDHLSDGSPTHHPSVPVRLSFPGIRLVSGLESRSGAAKEDAVNDVFVILYRISADGVEEFDSFVDLALGADGGTVFIDTTTHAVSWRIAAYANHGTLVEGFHDEDWMLFSKESLDGFQMYGSIVEDTDVLLEGGPFEIMLERCVTKVTVENVEVSWFNPAFRDNDFRLRAMYLTDVEGVSGCLHPVESFVSWYNMNGYVSSSRDDMLYSGIGRVALSESEPYGENHVFYAYVSPLMTYNTSPEWKEGGTRLVIEAELDGEVCYYPIEVNRDGLEDLRNRHIRFKRVVITKPGADEPYGILPGDGICGVAVSVEPWAESDNGSVDIM